MELIRDIWSKRDIEEFQVYLESLKNEDKIKWTTNIIQTKLPVLAIKSPVLKELVKKIYKGNYLSFLDNMPWDYHENTTINGLLISKIKDFPTMKKYLDTYSNKADNWATCDILSFNIKEYEKEYFNLLEDYIKNEKTFVRRIGIVILFNYVNSDQYIDKIFNILDLFTKEEEYYVNMINAWLVCEMFIKHREETLKYLENNKLNKFTINKGIQKCRDSYRISKEDKELLLKYKI